MLFQAEICLCGRDRCNSEDPIPEVEMLATNPPVENSNIVGQKLEQIAIERSASKP